MSRVTIRRSRSLDGEKLRGMITKIDLNTVFGAFRVDSDSVPASRP